MRVKILQEMLFKMPKSSEKVDLLELAKTLLKEGTLVKRPSGHPKFCLIIDAECCLNRLYGGYFADWICGGQWNRMAAFVTQLVTHLRDVDIELVVFFNGSVEKHRMGEWNNIGRLQKEKINSILQHVQRTHTSPQSRYWLAPVGLHMALRTVLRHMNVPMVYTTDDHHQQVMRYCREYNFHGLIADHSDYIAFDPPRLFSASHIKLTFKGVLETTQYPLEELRKTLGVNTRQMAILFATLKMLDGELTKLYAKAGIVSPDDKSRDIITKLAKFLSSNTLPENLDDLVTFLLDNEEESIKARLKESIQYYLSGTADGYKKFKHLYPGLELKLENGSSLLAANKEEDIDTSRLASESAGQENMIKTYKETADVLSEKVKKTKALFNAEKNGNADSSSAAAVDFTADASSPSVISSTSVEGSKKAGVDLKSLVPVEVISAIHERHIRGMTSPYLYQIVMQGEIRLPILLEETKNEKREIPDIHKFYKPIRQTVYGILFNNSQTPKKDGKTKQKNQGVHVTEYVWSSKVNRFTAEHVAAKPIAWKVPSIQRLWFGTHGNDKRRRLRAFLTCMRSDTELILNPDVVPQHCLVAAAVLRYIMTAPGQVSVLSKPELDSFLLTAVAPELVDVNRTNNLEVPVISTRGIQLATMFMEGVEMAFLVNDTCGAPVPWLMCCPWLFFNGALFQYTLYRSECAQNLGELCGNRPNLVAKVERMRQAVLQGLNVNFAKPARFTAAAMNMGGGGGGMGRKLGYTDNIYLGGPSGHSSWAPNYGFSPSAQGFGFVGGRMNNGATSRYKKPYRPSAKSAAKPPAKKAAKPDAASTSVGALIMSQACRIATGDDAAIGVLKDVL